MTESTVGEWFTSVQVSADRVRSAGERLLRRLWDDASALVARDPPAMIAHLFAEIRGMPAEIRRLGEQVPRRLKAGRPDLLGTLGEQATDLPGKVVRRVNVVSREDVADLARRVTQLEEQLKALKEGRAA